MKTAFVFPAFISEFLGSEVEILRSFSIDIQSYFDHSSEISGIDFSGFDLLDLNNTTNELRSQIVSYVFSCALADALEKNNIKPDFLAGYSMGLYAALYRAKSCSFSDGVRMIKKAFDLSKQAIAGMNAGMGSIIGLTESEVSQLIRKSQLPLEIANINSLHALLVTGPSETIDEFLDIARKTGALNVSRINVETPYHSEYLKGTHVKFRHYISNNLSLRPVTIPVISAINQNFISGVDQVVHEITSNLYRPINWMEAVQVLQKNGVTRFIECGAGKSLYNIGRFIEGDYKIYPINKIRSLVENH